MTASSARRRQKKRMQKVTLGEMAQATFQGVRQLPFRHRIGIAWNLIDTSPRLTWRALMFWRPVC